MAARSRVQIDTGGFAGAPTRLLRRAVEHALASEGKSGAEVSLALVSDERIRDLNSRYLAKDAPTDVLAFTLGDGDDLVGDVYVGYEQADRQAREVGVPLEEELARLAIHGTLHVLGHDHPEGPGRTRSAMFRLQERLLTDVLAGPSRG